MLIEEKEHSRKSLLAKLPIFKSRRFTFSRGLFLFLRLILFIFLLFFGIVTLIQWSPVQKRLVDYTSNYFSKAFNSTVKIDALNLSLLGTLNIQGVYLSEQNAPTDTILAIKLMTVQVNPTSFIWGVTQINQLVISDAKINLKRAYSTEKYNFDFILDYFSDRTKPRLPNKVNKPLPDIRFSRLRLRHIDFSLDDKYDGKLQKFSWEDALVTTNFVDLPKRLIDIANVNFKQLFVKIQEVPESFINTKRKVEADKKLLANPVSLDTSKIDASLITNNAALINDSVSIDKPFRFSLGALTVENSSLVVDKYDSQTKRELTPHNIDFDHMKFNNIDIFAHNIFYSNWIWQAVIDGVSCKEQNGFEILKFTVGDVKVTPTQTDLIGVRLETPTSVIGDTFRMSYQHFPSFRNFNNEVFMDAHINNAQIMLDDIMAFAPDLERNNFFKKNRKELAILNGDIKGRVNNLSLKAFKIEMKQNFNAEGDFDARDLTNSNETFIHLDLKDLKTDVLTLRSLIPDFNLTENYNKLGNLDFGGEFVGFYTDFTAKGKLSTELGDALVDMKLVPGTDLSESTTYSGFIELKDFELGNFTDNTDIGKLNIRADIIKGSGFSRDNLYLDINSTIYNLQYKNYAYTDINTVGNFSKKKFVGKIESKDPNAAFVFDGYADISAGKPVFNFSTRVFKIDFKQLGLMKDDIVISGTTDLNFTGGRLSELLGEAQFKNIKAFKNGSQAYIVDSLSLNVYDKDDGTKEWRIESDLGHATLVGKYNIEDIPDIVLTQLQRFHPRLVSDLKITPKQINTTATYFSFDVQINDTKNWTQLFDPKLGAFKDLSLDGKFDNISNEFNFNIDSKDSIVYDNINIQNFSTVGREKLGGLTWDLTTPSISIGDNTFNDLTFQNFIQGDSVEFGFTSRNLAPKFAVKEVFLNALLSKSDSSYSLSFGTQQFSKLQFFNNEWKIEKSNKIEFFKDSFAVNNFDINHDSAHILLKSLGRRGLAAAINNLDIAFVDSFVRDPRFTMRGKYQFDMAFSDVINFKDYTTQLHLDSFFVKNEYRGAANICASGKDFQEPVTFDAQILRGNESFDALGKYYISARDSFAANSIDVTGNFNNFDLGTLHYLIENGASEMRGGLTGALHVHGPLKKINTDGALRLKNGHVLVDYLKLPLNVKDALVTVTNNKFDATGDTIYDKFGNYALLTGGLKHNRFQNFGLDLKMSAPNFLFLDTKREDNAFYYGTGMGAGEVQFSGDFDRADIRIRASAGRGTSVVFPFASDQTVKEASFINFKGKVKASVDSSQIKKRVNDITGINLDMNINIRPEAELTLIFNEVSGDKLHGSGRGDIHFALNRAGAITMDGEVNIEKGSYSFSLLNFVQKNFELKSGGSISWSGSPFDAIINIEAAYKGLNTSPYNLIAEYVERDDQSQKESKKSTPVDLTLKLSNALLHPDINFDINFPNVTGNIKSYIENKLSLLRSDQNELNKQVFGLVVVGTFLPPNIQTIGQLQSSGINTATQSISSFLSDKLSKVLSEYVKGLDVEIGYNYYQFDLTDSKSSISGSQYRLRANYTLSDRVNLRGGLGLESGESISSTGSTTNLGGDFAIEYALNADKRLRLRISYIHDTVIEGSRDKTGVGLVYRKEFDNVGELLGFLKKKKSL